jgi:D-sedoheptulose 7-phosphate isomerase
VRRALETARSLGLLTVALTGGPAGGPADAAFPADHVLTARSDDPLIVKEMHVLVYHVLWELVHVFFERPGLLEQRAPAACEGPVCITCSDEAVEVRVVALRPGDLALVDTGDTHEEVSVALVDARVGSRVLVHAKEAIALLPDDPGDAGEAET